MIQIMVWLNFEPDNLLQNKLRFVYANVQEKQNKTN